jgi:hypothetical protein
MEIAFANADPAEPALILLSREITKGGVLGDVDEGG